MADSIFHVGKNEGSFWEVTGLCESCGLRPATSKWIADGCALCAARSGYRNAKNWCRLCVLDAQIAYSRKHADTLVSLEAERAMLEDPAR